MLEEDIKAQVDMALKKKDTKPLVESMARMLLVQENSKYDGSKNCPEPKKSPTDLKPEKMMPQKQKKNQNGIIIDWLQNIDPELKQLDVELRHKLLFNQNPHLLTVFSHLSNWDHLKVSNLLFIYSFIYFSLIEMTLNYDIGKKVFGNIDSYFFVIFFLLRGLSQKFSSS